MEQMNTKLQSSDKRKYNATKAVGKDYGRTTMIEHGHPVALNLILIQMRYNFTTITVF